MVLWATAASLVPAMTRGNEAARTAHITFNCMNILLFAWQVRLMCCRLLQCRALPCNPIKVVCYWSVSVQDKLWGTC